MTKKKKGLNPAEQLMYLHYLEILDDKGLYPRGHTTENLIATENYFLKMHTRLCALAEEAPLTADQANKFSWTKWKARAQSPENYNKIRSLIKLQLAVDAEAITGPDGFLSVKRKPGEVFGRTDMQILYELQSGQLRDGTEIDIYELYFGNAYELDHVTSLAMGGTTIITNGEILQTEHNRKKGAQSAEPAFDYQKVGKRSPQQQLEL